MTDTTISAPEPQGGAVGKITNAISQKMGLMYGLGMMFFSGWNQMLSSYWNYFLTNAVGMDPALMGTMTTISSFMAWIIVFIAAVIIERVWLRWGQYRSYMLFAPVCALVFIMGAWTDWTWIGVETGSVAQAVLIGGCYIIGQFFINLFMISATSMITVASRTEADRALMSARKAQGNLIIKLLFAAVSLPMIIFFAGGDVASNTRPDTVIGYTITAFIWGIVFVLAYVYLFKMFKGMDPTEEYCRKRAEAKKAGRKAEEIPSDIEKVSIWKCLKYFFTNLPALGLFIGEVGRAIWSMLLGAMAVYYCTVVFDQPMLYAGCLTLANAAGLVGTFCGEAIARKLGNRITYLTGIAIVIVSMIFGYFGAASSTLVFTVAIVVSFFGGNMMMAVEFSCMANAITYQEYKKGESAKAFIMGTIQWCPNIGKMFQGAIIGFGLASIGYSASVEVVSEAMVQGITFMTFMVPAIAMIVCFVVFFFLHRLTSAQMKEAEEALAERRAK
ncbi:MFS transporter [Raoultibacter massiliensis]|uniref:MFS transporter n=1 Tax=Raoultibacter massiliensis TaxID=1852371 RepID=A0ABV1JCJ9_9ACTN|nr:MFS transporter [Raoultibacter massiliensis]